MLFAGFSVQAAVSDLFPGDYFPPAPGSSHLTLYAYDRNQSGPYVRGQKRLDGELESSVLALRAVRNWQWGGTTMAGVLVLPWSDSRLGPAPLAAALGGSAQGDGDVRVGLTGWLINDKANANYLGVTAMLILPTGDYDGRQVLNSGENRWRLVLNAGWQKDITSRLLFELQPELAVYGDNDDYVGQRLEQRHSTALTTYLRYRASSAWHLHVGGQINRGGATRINGLAQHNPPNNTRVMAGMSWFLPDQQQLILRLAKDTDSDNGFRTDREVALRYQKVF
ncbi:transporter [Rhodocyclaceae bacterium]